MGEPGVTWNHTNGVRANGVLISDESPLEPIAIVGVGCRLPGGASNPSKLWELLEAGKSGWGPFPASRFNQLGFHSPSSVKAGTVRLFLGL